METKTKFTPSEAIASIEGMHRKKFYQMVSKGLISYNIEKVGTKAVKRFDGSELIRVFGNKFRISETRNKLSSSFKKQNETVDETVLLRQENEFLKQQVEREREIARELSRRLDDEATERRRLTAILTYQPETPPLQPETKPAKKKVGYNGC